MTATATAEETVEKKGNKKLLIIIIAAAVVILAAGGFVAFKLLAPAAAPEEDPATKPGAIVALTKDMTLNLSDGKFLKTNLALQLTEKATTAAGGEKALAAFDGSKARDAAIQVLGKYSYDQLLKPANRDAAQKALSAEVKKRYDGDVLQVYFTEFVMQ